MKPTNMNDTLVIGAGLSGLAAARALTDCGLPVTVLEAHDRVADPWRGRHPALRLNIHRKFAGLPGQAAPRSDGTYLKRDTVVAHLERYAGRLGAPIHYGSTVNEITPVADGWQVTTTNGVHHAENVVIATGRESVPHIPDWPGRESFSGELLHVADLGDVSRFDGKRVLVVGAGNSGTDALNHLASHRPAEVMVSVRYGPAVVPKRIFGYPLHGLARVFAALPNGVLDQAFKLTERLFLGDLRRYGLTSHPDGGSTRLLRDGVSRGNIAASGEALDSATASAAISAARLSMRGFTGLDGQTLINVQPKYLLTGPQNETAAEQLLASIYPATTGDVNVFANRLNLLIEPRITDLSWFIFADPARLPTFQYGYLSSAQGVQIQRAEAWSTLGLKFRAWLDFGAGWLDWRGAYLNEGA